VSILCLRTDKPQAEVYLYEHQEKLAEIKWEADRQLSVTLHTKINELFKLSAQLKAGLTGIVVYKGPGSFTGLRLGFSVANALAYASNKSIVSNGGENWIKEGIARLTKGENEKIALPEYGRPANITTPKK
jgi:tRNA threonylcarbamoyladenosine biosynthesis protein TsaB